MSLETLTMFNGNGQRMEKPLPTIWIMDSINDVALSHIAENTNLHFERHGFSGYIATPTSSNQIARLFLTYNFKTRYFNNADLDNTLLLKFKDREDWD